jgi:hypothetical protein
MMLLANAPRTTDDIDMFWLEEAETIESALNVLFGSESEGEP